MVDPSKKVPDLKCEVPDLLSEVVDLKQEVSDLRSGGIPLNLTPGFSTVNGFKKLVILDRVHQDGFTCSL